MTIEYLVREFGYLAVFIGTFLEGENDSRRRRLRGL